MMNLQTKQDIHQEGLLTLAADNRSLACTDADLRCVTSPVATMLPSKARSTTQQSVSLPT